jgi:hypothetical protein
VLKRRFAATAAADADDTEDDAGAEDPAAEKVPLVTDVVDKAGVKIAGLATRASGGFFAVTDDGGATGGGGGGCAGGNGT